MKLFTWCKMFLVIAFLVSLTWSEAKAQLLLNSVGDTAKITFSGFRGKGFTPVAGNTDSVLNSNIWAVFGESANSYFGNTSVSGIFAMGTTKLPVTSGGIFAYADTVRSDTMMMLQPTGTAFSPGSIVIRIRNNSTDTLSGLYLAYHLFVRNDQARANSFNFSHSADTNIYIPVPSLDYTSTAAAGTSDLIDEGIKSVTLSGLVIIPGQDYYLRWNTNDVSGSGSRDEFFLDDIKVAGLLVGDVSAPYVIGMNIINPNTIQIYFNEAVDTTAENQSNYSGFPTIQSIHRETMLDTVTLNLATPVQNGKKYTINVSGVKDLAGNAMNPVYYNDFQYNNLSAGIVINELYYNSPGGGVDSMEFIELYNNTSNPVNIGGIYFSHGVFDTLPDSIIAAHGYFVTAYFPEVFARYFGFTPHKWSGNNLSNSGERVAIVNTIGDTIDALFYTTSAPWPMGVSDNNARSYSLIHSDLDNSDGGNWRLSALRHALFNGLPGWATPGQLNLISSPALIEPADGLYFTVSSVSTDNMTFRWNESIVPVGGSVYYVVELVDAVNNAFNTIYEGTDTTFDYSLANFDNWLASNNWPVNDTAYGITWRVTANDSVNEFISNGFEMFPVRENVPPLAFDLLEPADGFRWEVSTSSTDSISFRWNKSIDPEGNPINYTIQFEASGLGILLNYETGTDTFFVDYANLRAELLQSSGWDSVVFSWTVLATDSINPPMPSNETRTITHILIPESVTPFRADLAGYQVVPPVPTAASGTGYFELNADSTELFYRIYVNSLTGGITDSYIRNAPAGSNVFGGYALTFVGDSAVGTWNTITPELVDELLAGYLYVLVRTSTYPAGEIRGQIRQGMGSVVLTPAANLNAIGFEGAIELDWTEFKLFSKSTSMISEEKYPARKSIHIQSDKSCNTNKTRDFITLLGFNIYRSIDGDTYEYLDQTDSLFYIDTNVVIGSIYRYFVSAVYDAGQAPPTDTVAASLITSTYPISVLFVTDENLGYGNAVYIRNSFSNLGLLYDHFNAIDSGRTPTSAEVGMYDLVIWYCSYDGVGSYFWNGTDSDNTEIADYLDNGGRLWVMGTDLLYDRYGAPPVSFSSTDFPNKYLGIASYDVQSYGNDGGAGCSKLFRNTSQSVCQVDSFGWIYPTAWWIDGLTPAMGALPVYNMGPLTYVLADKPTAIYYDNGIHKALGFYFDPYEIDTDTHRDSVFADVLQWFSWGIVGIKDKDLVPKETSLYQNYPNPFNPTTSIKYDLKDNAKVILKIYNTLGQEVRTLVNTEQTAGQYTMQWDGRNNAGLSVASGVYIYRIQAGDFVKSKKMMFIK